MMLIVVLIFENQHHFSANFLKINMIIMLIFEDQHHSDINF